MSNLESWFWVMPACVEVLSAFSKVVKLSLPAHAFIVFLGTRYFRLAPRQLIIPVLISSTIFILVCSSPLSNGLRLTTAVVFFFFASIDFIFLSLVTSHIRTRHKHDFTRKELSSKAFNSQVLSSSKFKKTIGSVVFYSTIIVSLSNE